MADPNNESDPGRTKQAGETSLAADAVARVPSDRLAEGERLRTNEIEKLLDQATESLDQAASGQAPDVSNARPFTLSDLKPKAEGPKRQPIELLGEVEMDLRIELGRTLMRLDDVLQLRSGSVVALDKLAGDPVDVFVNGRLIARGEVLVMNDNFCIRVTELVGV